jgi:hypothetical protein
MENNLHRMMQNTTSSSEVSLFAVTKTAYFYADTTASFCGDSTASFYADTATPHLISFQSIASCRRSHRHTPTDTAVERKIERKNNKISQLQVANAVTIFFTFYYCCTSTLVSLLCGYCFSMCWLCSHISLYFFYYCCCCLSCGVLMSF